MKRQRGFTLLEVMVATAILGVGIATVSGGFSTTARSTALAAGYERARLVAETELEQFLSTRAGELRRDRIDGSADGVRWRLSAEPDPEQPGLMRVTIEARFFAAGERTLVLETWEVDRAVPADDENSNDDGDRQRDLS